MNIMEKERHAVVIQVAEHCEFILNSARCAAQQFADERLGVDAIQKFAASPDPAVRRKALFLLSLWDSRSVLPVLADALLHDPSRVVRHEAAFLLASLHMPEAVDPLAVALCNDREELVRHEAAEALGDLGFQIAVEPLQRALDDRSEMVKETVKMALSQLAFGT